MNPTVETIMLSVLHDVPSGSTIRIPFVSPASQKWYCMMKVSREQRPMKAKPLEYAERKTGVAFRRTMKDSTGTHETYGCHRLYVNLLG